MGTHGCDSAWAVLSGIELEVRPLSGADTLKTRLRFWCHAKSLPTSMKGSRSAPVRVESSVTFPGTPAAASLAATLGPSACRRSCSIDENLQMVIDIDARRSYSGSCKSLDHHWSARQHAHDPICVPAL